MKFSYFILGVVTLWFSALNVSATDNPVACTMEYAPVCGSVQVQCIMAPCNPIRETFSNSCVAAANHATNVTPGACEVTVPPVIVWGDRDAHGCIPSAGYTWSESMNICIRPWESPKMSVLGALQSGTWVVSTLNNRAITSSGTLTFGKNTFSAKLCNTINARYGVLRWEILIVRGMMSTRMYCDSDIMQVEDAMNHLTLSRLMVWSDTLTITTRRGDVIVWKKK